jgi:hypothetical protein
MVFVPALPEKKSTKNQYLAERTKHTEKYDVLFSVFAGKGKNKTL